MKLNCYYYCFFQDAISWHSQVFCNDNILKVERIMMVIIFNLLSLEQATNASGFFEVQILSLTNNRGTLVDGRCCGGGGDGGGKGELPPCTTPCSTAFWLCLKEYQSNVTAIGSCSFGNVSSHALGQNTFTLSEPVTLQLHFTFRWTVSGSSFPFFQFYLITCLLYNIV